MKIRKVARGPELSLEDFGRSNKLAFKLELFFSESILVRRSHSEGVPMRHKLLNSNLLITKPQFEVHSPKL